MKRGFILRAIVFLIVLLIFSFGVTFIRGMHGVHRGFFDDFLVLMDILEIIALPILIIIGLLKFVFGKNKE
jgi:hypothetical protein